MATQLARRMARALIGLSGLEIRRLREAEASAEFYPTQASCQVPDIGFLLELFFGRREEGVFVEVGAYDGTSFSNTWGLAVRGWSGLLIEPVPEFAARCAEAHSNHPNVKVANVAIGRGDRPTKDLTRAGALTTDSLEQVEEYRRLGWLREEEASQAVIVPCVRLDHVLETSGIAPGFEVLVVDVEGQEEEVFASFDLDRWTPGMLIVEIADTHPELETRRGPDYQLHTRLLNAGYWTAYKDRINTVLVRRDLATKAYQAWDSVAGANH